LRAGPGCVLWRYPGARIEPRARLSLRHGPGRGLCSCPPAFDGGAGVMSPANDAPERNVFADTGEPILQCRELSRIFKVGMGLFAKSSDLVGVDRVDLDVRKGQTLAIVGESGSGKTTLGRMLLGILPASKGEILLHGRPVRGFDRRRLARMVQPIFQDPYSSLNPRKTIGQTIEAPLIIHGVSSAHDRLMRVRKMMDSVGLASRLIHSYGNQLSGGQR